MKKLVILVLLLGFIAAQEPEGNWVRRLLNKSDKFNAINQAAKLLAEGKNQLCHQVVAKCCEEDKELPPAEFILAVMYIETKKQDVGRKLLEQSGSKYPDFPGTYILLGNIALNEKRNVEANLLYERATLVMAKNSWKSYQSEAFMEQIYTGLAALAERKNDWNGMVANFEKLLAIKGKDGALRQKLAITKFRSGKVEGVFAELEKAKEENPKIEAPEMTMAKLYMEKEDKKEAAKWMKLASKKYSTDGRILFLVSQWLYERDMLAEAKKQAIDAKNAGFESVAVDVFLAVILREEKNFSEAEKLLTTVHQNNPTNFNASNQLILVLIESDDPEKKKKAFELAKINAKLFSNNLNSLSTLGWVCLKLGSTAEANKFLTAAIKGNNTTAETAYYMAHLAFKQGQLQQLKQWLQISVSGKQHFIYEKEAKKWLEQLNKVPE